MEHVKVENDHAILTLEDNILVVRYKPGEIGLMEAKQIVVDRLALFDGKKYPGVAIDDGVTKITKEARDYLSSPEGIESVSAAAVVTNKPIGNMIINFIIRVQKPPIPVRTFTSLEAAKIWLSQYI